ncbi:MAG: Gldg family protein, partial [Bacteroidales bacterium]|nr:Gldg family protein [Bacteroidales bacterium]
MKQIFRISKTELQVLFYSPIAWFVLVIFAFQCAGMYTGWISQWGEVMQLGGRAYQMTETMFMGIFGMFPRIDRQLFYYIPLLTMGLVSRELSSGSIKLLYSSPISNTQIIMGKFMAMAIYGFIMVGILGLMYIHAAIVIDNFDWAFPLVGLLGLFLSICVYGAIGIYMSSLTSYQMVAALSTFVVLTVLSQVAGWWQSIDFVRDITYWLSIRGRSTTFLRGMLCSEDFLYFVVVTALFVVLTIFRLNSKREKLSRVTTLSRYGILFVVVIGIGYMSSRPNLKMYWDATHFDRNTIPKGSLDVLNELKGQGKMTITTYNNIFDEERLSIMIGPEGEVFDMKSFEQYIRFKSDISMKYVYYYSTKGFGYNAYKQRHKDKTDEEIIEILCKRMRLNPSRLLTEEQVLELEPGLADEDFRLVKVVTMEDGRKGFIRYFNDMMARPFDREITATFKRMILEKFPKVAFLSGTGRVITQGGDMNYSNFTDKLNRTSLYNQGFDVTSVDLKTPIDADVNIMVIADMNFTMTPEQKANYQQFIDRGGNLFILGEPVNYQYTNAIVEQFGVKALAGRIVQGQD